MREILFVCTGNTCRSAMAQYLFNTKAAQRGLAKKYRAASAGISAFDYAPATAQAQEVLKNRKIDAGNHRAARLQEEHLKSAYIVLCMTKQHAQIIKKYFPEFADKVYSVSEYINDSFDINDPYGLSVYEYEKTAKQLESIIEQIIDKLEMEKM